MGFSRSARIITLLVIDSLFFLLEIIVGYSVHSLALVADSFHMLNDVFSLLVALWAIKLAKQKSTSSYTYGWQRAEVLGALINGVFLLALCLSIFLEAIQRFFEPQEVGQPVLVLAVGSAGLASNILGLFLFHDHGHSHGGGDSHGHSHTHDMEAGIDGHERHKHTHGLPGHIHNPAEDDSGDIEEILPATVVARVASDANPISRPNQKHKRNSSRQAHFASPVTHIHVHPARNRQEVIAAAVSDTEATSGTSDDEGGDESTPLVSKNGDSSSSPRRRAHSVTHTGHNHTKPKPEGTSGHSHANLNMRGVFLHVLGDALGNVGVMAVALCLMYIPDKYTWKNYLDPSISLIITVIIFSSALPLVKSASKILLQAVPTGISLEEVKEDIADIHGVESVHELHIWQLSDVKMIASLHIQIAFDPDQGGRYMQLARSIRTCLHAYGIHSSTIQPEYTKPAGGDVIAADMSHGGEQVTGYGATASGSRAESVTGSDSACLLDCGDGCATVKCCGPVEQQTADPGHGHSH
ncbi:cation efflux protein [Morchella snyderi]|nr:cation efflux protein [Morchella snyderi]